MKTAQHTPGPWTIGEREQFIDGFPRILANNGKNGVATMLLWGSDVTNANARLIAAAPDLLAALQDLSAWAISLSEQSDENAQDLLDRFRRNHCGAMFAAEKAIAKATGG